MRSSIQRGLVQVFFDAKPSSEMRSALKANGFRWSPQGRYWHRQRVEGAADFLCWLERACNPGRPDGACWRCKSPDGFFRPRGASTPVLCAKCRAEDLERENRPDRTDMTYEDQCREMCGL